MNKGLIAAAFVFIAVNAMAWFCFWIGGGELFTSAAGAVAFCSFIMAIAAAFIAYMEIRYE